VSPAPIELPAQGITDGEIRIRLLADADVPVIADACRDPAIQRFTTVPDPYAEEDARAWGRRSAESAAAGMGIEAVIAEARSNRALGSIGLRRSGHDQRRWAIGYMVFPGERNRGIASRAVSLISRFAFDHLEAERLEIEVEPENVPSLRVAERAGYSREGMLPSHREINGVRRDMVMYSLTSGELQ
jgi:[ribosomal protein S5]-alanine N-acetyltransferase